MGAESQVIASLRWIPAGVLLVAAAAWSPLAAGVDLRIGPQNLTVRPPGPYEKDQRVVVYVAAHNDGDQSADATLRLECVETGRVLLEQTLSFAARFHNATEKLWTIPRHGTLTLRLSVNPDRTVAETRYDNNVVEKSITVQAPDLPPPPPLAITRFEILPEPPVAGQTMLIQLVVNNASEQEQQFDVFAFYRRPETTGDSVATFSQAQRLAAGRDRVVEMTWTTPSYPSFPLRVEVRQGGEPVATHTTTVTVAFPDLSIRRHAMEPKLPAETTQPHLDVVVANTDTVAHKVWVLAKEPGKTHLGRQLVTVPGKGEAQARLTLPRRPAGRYELLIELNTSLQGATPIREATLENNRARMFWVVRAAPDAAFGRIIVADARDYAIWSECRARQGERACRPLYSAADVQVEEPLAFEIQVRNLGKGEGRFAGAVSVRERGSREPGTVVVRFDSGVLQPGRSDVVRAGWTPTRTGRYELIFELDPQNTVAEIDERNNRSVQSINVHHRYYTGVVYVGLQNEVELPPAQLDELRYGGSNSMDTRDGGVRFSAQASSRRLSRDPHHSYVRLLAYTDFEVREGELGERRGRADLEINLAALGHLEHVDPEIPVIGLAVGAASYEIDAEVRLYQRTGGGSPDGEMLLRRERLFQAANDRDWAAELAWALLDFKSIGSTAEAIGELFQVDQVVIARGYAVLRDVPLVAGQRYALAIYVDADCRANGVGAKAEVDFKNRAKSGDPQGRILYADDARGLFLNHVRAVWRSTD